MPSQIAPPLLDKFPVTKQRRLDQLLSKNSDGTISAEDRVVLEQLVAEAEQLMASNGNCLADFVEQSGISIST